MGRRGGNLSLNQNRKRRKLLSDDSDEDYVLNENENYEDDEEFNDLKGFLASDDDDEEQYVSEEDSLNYGAVIFSSDEEKKKRKVDRSSKTSKLRIDDDLERKETRVRRLVERNKVSDDDDFCDEDDKDDEEFNPDEVDLVDEEEDLQVETRDRIPRKHVSHEKNSSVTKSQKRKRKSKVLNKSIRKKRKKVVAERTLSTDDDFDADFKSMRRRSKKKSKKRRNTSVIEDSDSDGACSEPSDCEYTITDEEKELLREANNFVGTSSTGLRNSSLSKRRLHVHGDSKCQQLRLVGIKGKEMVTNQEDTGKQVCGICFSEEGDGIVRGTLNCCSHYFCFACIMEWSKVESRCPLCKQRFATIRKHTNSSLGIHLRNLVIPIPRRDQVYQPSEEEVRGYLDPYDGVVCIECHLGGEDSLMLLCDICDSPAHTFCVGLGREVPEGNWYCRGCRVSNSGPSDLQVRDLSHGTHTSGLPNYMSSQRSNMEHFDATPHLSVSASDPTSMHEYGVLLSPRYPVGDDVHLPSPTGLGVSTLSGRRMIHRQIRNLLSNNIMSQRTEMATRTDDGNVGSEVIADAEDEQINKSITQHA
ncbi:Phd and ring finger domain-containing [Thalictrum thalictroides]|uniref:Phd and ring finger domain-containing n=1 Tax=Thalictrum thalictroides TaxID=46969 RepID=A0A7J6VPR6_THATH|nr:Phd and ring finger domain-containing [Thalictrum thalictroides]